MGMVIGDLSSDNRIAYVNRLLVLSRKDRQKDRVEVRSEDLAICSTIAEHITRLEGGINNKIIGWYHSHPHITVLPSHVDVRTQGNFQHFNSGFLGLIFSVFDKGRLEVCAFQSKQSPATGTWERVEIPIAVCNFASPKGLNPRTGKYGQRESLDDRRLEHLMILPMVLLNEEREIFDEYCRDNLKVNTTDSAANASLPNHPNDLETSRALIAYQGSNC